MSETSNEVETAAVATKRPPPEQVVVKMEDGREVTFVGKRRMIKSSTIDAAEGSVSTRFDFVDGTTRSLTVGWSDNLALKLLGHGIEQKVGDETAGDKEVEDMVLHVDNILARLAAGEWGIERGGSGDSFAGANVVIRAIAEVKGKDIAWVKAFLEKKIADSGTNAEGKPNLSRQALYKAFRMPGSKTAPVIARMEAEKASKASGIDANTALDEMDD